MHQVFLKYLHKSDKNTIIYITPNTAYYTFLHIKLSSFFYSTQLIDIFAYELPINKNDLPNFEVTSNIVIPAQSSTIVVYNFHSLLTQQRFFFFINTSSKPLIAKKNLNTFSITSLSELFMNANWLEREAAELHGIFFHNKKDVRNLMLQYGDTSAPLKKSFPSIGIKEIFYDASTDLLIQAPVSIQF